MSPAHRPLVLLVDDEPQILSALRRALRREGYRLIAAETAQEALRQLEEQPVDCILSDHKMPGLTGLQLLERAAALRPGAVRLLITGWNEELSPSELERVGVRQVLSKPWDDAELKAALRSAIGAGTEAGPSPPLEGAAPLRG